jgi:hypothetical protein
LDPPALTDVYYYHGGGSYNNGTSGGGSTGSAAATTTSTSSSTTTDAPPLLPLPPPPLGRSHTIVLQPRSSPKNAARAVVQPANLRGTAKNPIYLYYDAAHAISNGNLHVPQVVYDDQGRPIPLASLHQKEVYLEAPSMSMSSSSSSGSAQAQQQQQGSLPQRIRLDLAQLWKTNSSSSNNTRRSRRYDDSIVIGTVAVMALLVGALSARRLRHRSFLASCIENESLEDEVAYDTAYTTTTTNSIFGSGGGGGHTYDTFGGRGARAAAQPWKGGDLEKFDV